MSAAHGFGSPAHLAGRFFTALWPGGPPARDEQWALGLLLPGEQQLWRRMSGPDRRHGVSVARRAVQLLGGGEAPREVVAAALLHDVGKVEAGLGTFSRVGVTLAAIAVGRERLVASGSSPAGVGPVASGHADARADDGRSMAGRGLRRRAAVYLCHDKLGGDLLRQAGSHELTVQWAEQHHLPPGAWTLDPRTACALKEADGD
jgi:hypothetical protein